MRCHRASAAQTATVRADEPAIPEPIGEAARVVMRTPST